MGGASADVVPEWTADETNSALEVDDARRLRRSVDSNDSWDLGKATARRQAERARAEAAARQAILEALAAAGENAGENAGASAIEETRAFEEAMA